MTTSVEHGRKPILVTFLQDALSPFVWLELTRVGGRWVAIDDEGISAVDVLTWREVPSVTDAADPAFHRQEPRSDRTGAIPSDPAAAVILEASVFHAPDADLVVGDLIEELVGAIDGSSPDAWGETEPLERRWDRSHLTQLMRAGMPRTEIIRGHSNRDPVCHVHAAHRDGRERVRARGGSNRGLGRALRRRSLPRRLRSLVAAETLKVLAES